MKVIVDIQGGFATTYTDDPHIEIIVIDHDVQDMDGIAYLRGQADVILDPDDVEPKIRSLLGCAAEHLYATPDIQQFPDNSGEK